MFPEIPTVQPVLSLEHPLIIILSLINDARYGRVAEFTIIFGLL